jgi:LysM repeat protein
MMIQRLFRPTILFVALVSILSREGLRADASSDAAMPATSPSANAVPPSETAPAVSPTEISPAPTPTPTPAGSPTDATTTTAANPETYTVVSGDTLWALSHKFNTSIKKLKKLNHLTKNNLKPGQVLKIPSNAATPAKKSTSLKTKSKTKVAATHHHPKAQPVQNVDLTGALYPAASIPTWRTPSGPLSAGLAENLTKPAPQDAVAESTSARNMTADNSAILSHRSARDSDVITMPETMASSVPATTPHRGLFNFFYTPPPSVDWGTRFTQEARDLGDRGLEYDEDWRPPGEAHSWSMDCSNTSRYLYRVVTGIQLPRTASDQYYYLHLQNKAWDVPQMANGFADCNYLRRNLKAGDLLFWENTYRPDRQPPITHVMIFLGTNARGEWTMAGSQSTRGGEHNRRHGGPDIYVFNPERPCGGYSTWLGLVHHQGRFCAFGRPLEADKSKLAMAAND